MVNIWSKVADKTKLLGLLEQELEVLQLQKLNLESTVMTSSLERSDLLMNNYLDKKTDQTMNKGGYAGENDNNEQFGNKKWEDEDDFTKNNKRKIKTVN